jgi:hypothetical protein
MATRAGRLIDGRQQPAHGPKPEGVDPPADPCIWILLAEDALSAGRHDQAEELVEQAYRVYNEAMTDVATSCSGSEEEESEFDVK